MPKDSLHRGRNNSNNDNGNNNGEANGLWDRMSKGQVRYGVGRNHDPAQGSSRGLTSAAESCCPRPGVERDESPSKHHDRAANGSGTPEQTRSSAIAPRKSILSTSGQEDPI